MYFEKNKSYSVKCTQVNEQSKELLIMNHLVSRSLSMTLTTLLYTE